MKTGKQTKQGAAKAVGAAAMFAAILPGNPKWQAITGYGEEQGDKNYERNWWFGNMVGDKPEGIGYFLFRRGVSIERGGGDEFGAWAYALRRAECYAGGEVNWAEDISVFGDDDRARFYAEAHRLSPAGFHQPGSKVRPKWHKYDGGRIDRTTNKELEVWWLGAVKEDGDPLGTGWFVCDESLTEPAFEVYWMRGQSDVRPTERIAKWSFPSLKAAKRFATGYKKVLWPNRDDILHPGTW